MIFSKDKKPTEAGQFWALSSHTGAIPFVASVHATLKDSEKWEFELSVQLVNEWGTAEELNWLWGDRVEVPTIESSNEEEGTP